jgi:glycosyltransferase involved in cell wall biosynthesis
MNVAVVLSTYNRPKALSLVLRGLASQTEQPAEIIIADDGSTADTRIVIESFCSGLPCIKHLWQPDEGFRKTRILNQAICASKADLLIFLDGDCIPMSDFVSSHRMLYEPKVVCAGQRVLLSAGYTKRLESGANRSGQPSRSSLMWFYRFLRGDINRISPFISLPDWGWRLSKPKNHALVRGCNFSVSRQDAIKVGGFEEQMEGWGFEDSEFAIRLINSGLRVKSLRYSSPVLHLWHPEANRDSEGKNRAVLNQAISSVKTFALKGLEYPVQ